MTTDKQNQIYVTKKLIDQLLVSYKKGVTKQSHIEGVCNLALRLDMLTYREWDDILALMYAIEADKERDRIGAESSQS